MNTRIIEFYDEFECMGGRCPDTCCKGWNVAVDADTYNNYKDERGALGALLCLMTKETEDGGAVFRRVCNQCLFLDREGLCSFQKKGRHELVPAVCKAYPRRSIVMEDECEITFELACIQAAEIFARHPGRLTLIKSNEEPYTKNVLGNHELNFRNFLYKSREEILDYWWDNPEDMKQKLITLADYGYRANEALAMNGVREARMIKIGGHDVISPQGFGIVPVVMLNEIVYECLWRDGIKHKNPYLYKLLRRYDKEFGEYTERKARGFFVEYMDKLIDTYPRLETIFMSYYSYVVQQTYLEAYEDYYVWGKLIMADVYTELFMFMVLVDQLTGDSWNENQIPKVLAATERALRHNSGITKIILDKVRKYILN